MNAVITGATKGMGKAIADNLAKAGYNLAICSRNQPEIDSFCNDLMTRYPNIHASGISTDCSEPDQVKQFANFVLQQFEKVDVLVNNAGIFNPGFILDEDDTTLANQYQVNFNTAYILCKTIGRKMREVKAGHIITICSVAAINPIAEAGSYTVTKFAVNALSKVLRSELMQHNVKVTAIFPGSTLTDSWKGTSLPPERFVLAEDIANAVTYAINTSAGANVDEISINPLKGII